MDRESQSESEKKLRSGIDTLDTMKSVGMDLVNVYQQISPYLLTRYAIKSEFNHQYGIQKSLDDGISIMNSISNNPSFSGETPDDMKGTFDEVIKTYVDGQNQLNRLNAILSDPKKMSYLTDDEKKSLAFDKHNLSNSIDDLGEKINLAKLEFEAGLPSEQNEAPRNNQVKKDTAYNVPTRFGAYIMSIPVSDIMQQGITNTNLLKASSRKIKEESENYFKAYKSAKTPQERASIKSAWGNFKFKIALLEGMSYNNK